MLDRLGDMQQAVAHGAGARQMATDLDAATQAATELSEILPDDPATPQRQHMGFDPAQTGEVPRLQDAAPAEQTTAEPAVEPEPPRTIEITALPHDPS
ncbi:hypothetical protein ACTU45_06505 [Streptomyces sp. 24-1644]|uniref:hypothetical protein n=1 Tax=Streptomyces sp. 24-1644 TaxID=3457315 RepID=UPI003FA6E0EE